MAEGADGFTFLPGEKATLNKAWKKMLTHQLADHSHVGYNSNLIYYLGKTECVVSYPETYIREIWADFFERMDHMSREKAFNEDIEGKDFWITSKAVAKILLWRLEQAEEEDEDEVEDIIDDGNDIIDGAIGNIKEWIKQAILAGLAFLEEPLRIIKDIIATVGNAISTFASSLEASISTIMAKVTGMFETIVGKLKGVIDEVWNNIQLIWETLKDVYDTIKTAIVTAFKTSWEFIKHTLTTLWDKMKIGLKWIADSIVKGIKFLWEKIKDGLNWVGAVLKSAYTALKDVLIAVWDRTKERLQQTIESIKTGFGDAIDRLTDFFLWLWEKITAIFDKVFDMSEEALEEMGYRVLSVQKRILERFVKDEGIV